PGCQFKHKAGEVCFEDFWLSPLYELVMPSFTPQAITGSRLEAPCATGTLIGGVARNRSGHQTREAAAWIEGGNARQATIDHYSDALNRQRCFGNGCSQNNFASA